MGVIFRKGKILKRVTEAEMLDELKAEILRAAEDKRNGVEVESHHNPNVYKPTLTLTSV
jgi:hypothetical protein